MVTRRESTRTKKIKTITYNFTENEIKSALVGWYAKRMEDDGVSWGVGNDYGDPITYPLVELVLYEDYYIRDDEDTHDEPEQRAEIIIRREYDELPL